MWLKLHSMNGALFHKILIMFSKIKSFGSNQFQSILHNTILYRHSYWRIHTLKCADAHFKFLMTRWYKENFNKNWENIRAPHVVGLIWITDVSGSSMLYSPIIKHIHFSWYWSYLLFHYAHYIFTSKEIGCIHFLLFACFTGPGCKGRSKP